MRVRLPNGSILSNGVSYHHNNNYNNGHQHNHNNSLNYSDSSSGSGGMTGSQSGPDMDMSSLSRSFSSSNLVTGPIIRIEKESSSAFSCGVTSVTTMSAEYTFSPAFRFGSKVWKLGAKRLKDVYSFLIYPMDMDDKSSEEGYAVQMVIMSDKEEADQILVQGRREFNNNATIFVWTASYASLRPFLVDDRIFIQFNMETLAPGHIFSSDGDTDFRDKSSENQIMEKKTGQFPIILTGIRDISLNGISSPPFSFEGHQWELKMCQNGNLYAFRIMCNRKQLSKFSVCAKIQLAVQSPPNAPAAGSDSNGNHTGSRTIHVEGSRRFRDSDDSMFWSFDKRLDKYVNDDALSVSMKITVYTFKDKPVVDDDNKESASTSAPAPVEKEPEPVPEKPAPAQRDVHIGPDMRLIVGKNETQIPVHRHLLIHHSPWVSLMAKKVRGLCRVKVPDCEVPEITSLLKFIYCGKLDINETNFVATLKAAKKFEMKDIFTACSSLITQANVLMFVNMTDDCSVSRMIWNIVDTQAKEVLKSGLFVELSANNVMEIVSRDSLDAPEMAIYEACINWASAEVKRQKLTPNSSSIRKVLDKILYQVRFPLMDPIGFSMITDDQSRDYYKVLTDKEALGVFRAIHTKDTKATVFSMKQRTPAAPLPSSPVINNNTDGSAPTPMEQ